MPFDDGPRELDQVAAAGAVAEYPVVVPELVELAVVPVDDPALRLVVVLPGGPLVGEDPEVPVQRVEHLRRHHAPVVGRPSPDDGVERRDDRYRVAAAQGAHLGCEPFPEPPDSRLARLDQQLGSVPADIEPEEVKTLAEAGDARLVL